MRGPPCLNPLDLPNIDAALFQQPDTERLLHRARHARAALPAALRLAARTLVQPPAAEEAARILRALGGETRLFNPSGLPLVDDAPITRRSRNCANWRNGPKAWCGVRRSATAR
jgi:arsenic resistance protein ArsH